jgi:HSP20 family protein
MTTNGETRVPVIRRALFPERDDFRDLLHAFDARWPALPALGLFGRADAAPLIDMFERDGKVIVRAEMPGMEPPKIEVSVAAGELRISGERTEEKEVKEGHCYRSERTFGRMYRSIRLPDGCDTEQITANTKDGVVEIVIPKKAAAATRKVEVKRG